MLLGAQRPGGLKHLRPRPDRRWPHSVALSPSGSGRRLHLRILDRSGVDGRHCPFAASAIECGVVIALIGPEDLLIVVAIAALLFGGKKIPEFARALGRAKNEFEKGLREGEPKAKSEDGEYT